MKKRTILDEIKNLNSHKPKTTFKEMFDSMEDEQNYFDEEDFLRAQAAAQQDIGSDFKDFGTTPAEKGLNFQDMIDDLKRQNLSLPNDEKELEKIKQSGVVNPHKYLAKKQSKQFGAGSINESKDSMFIGLQKLKSILNHPEVEYMDFGYGTKEKRVKDILEDGVLLKEGMPGLTHNNIFPYNYLMDQWGPIWYFAAKIKGNMGTEVVDFDFSDEEKARIQHEETPEELAQGDFEAIASEDERELYEEGYKLSNIDPLFTKLKELGFNPIVTPKGTIDIEVTSMHADEIISFFTVTMTSKTGEEHLYSANLYYQMHDGPGQGKESNVFFGDLQKAVDCAIKYKVDAEGAINSLPKSNPTPAEPHVGPRIVGKIDLGHAGNTDRFKHESIENIERVMDSEGNPITLRCRVEDLTTGSAGRVVRFGIDDNNKQTVHVDWIQSFGKTIPKSIVYPETIVVRDETRTFVKETEIEEGVGHSHTVGRGQNIKPGNYPQTLKRVGLKENLNLAQPASEEKEVYLVVDNDFNRAHYKDLIGQTFDDAPGYAAVKVVKPSEIKENLIQEIDEYYIPEELRPFYISESIHTKDSTTTYEYTLKIKKQSDETPKDIINFIKEAENKKVDVILEYEKGSEKWVAKVLVN